MRYKVYVEGRNLFSTITHCYEIEASGGEFDAVKIANSRFKKDYPPEYTIYCSMVGYYDPPAQA